MFVIKKYHKKLMSHNETNQQWIVVITPTFYYFALIKDVYSRA